MLLFFKTKVTNLLALVLLELEALHTFFKVIFLEIYNLLPLMLIELEPL